MDSTIDKEKSYYSDPYDPNEDNEITYLVNANIYKQWRSEYVDEIELSVWNIDMVKFAISTTYDEYGSIKTAIQRGVPDIIKHYIWIKANDADKFYIDNPSFYTDSFASTFGDTIPTEMGDYCPTFSGGIFGLQSDLVESPIVLDQLHTKFDRSLESKVFHDTEHEYSYWMNPYKDYSPSDRDGPSVPASTKKSAKMKGKGYSMFKKFKQKPENGKRLDSSSCSDSSKDDFKNDGLMPPFNQSQESELNKNPEFESASSLYSIHVSDLERGSKTGMGNKDRLIDYIHLLNNENANKRKLMKSALTKIRKSSEDKKSIVRNLEKSRQMSDTFLYNTQYSYFPPPPSHHSKLIQSSIEMSSALKPYNPFLNVISQNKIKKRRFFCIPFICGSRKKDKSKDAGPPDASNQEIGYRESSSSFKDPYHDNYRNSEPNLIDNTSDYHADHNQEDAYTRRKYSDAHALNYGSSTINHLPIINTIPEHSASNSVAISYSRSCSKTSNVDDGLDLYETAVDADSLADKGLLLDNLELASTAPSANTYGDSNFDLKPAKKGLSGIYSKDVELINTLSKELSRNLTSTSIDRSVYKLDDVTDFTVLLTDEGVVEAKRILWVLNSYFSSKIEFLPVIPSLCCLLLIYLSPNAVLCLLYRFMSKCVNSSSKDIGIRFFFVERKGFVTFVTFVISVLSFHAKKVVDHLKSMRVDLAAWVARSIQTGFSQILPFDYIVRIYGNLLFEGEMVLCRYCVALVKCISGKLLATTSKEYAEELLYHVGLDDSIQIDRLTKIAYSLRIKKFDKKIHNVDTPTPYLMNVKIRRFYRPRLSSKSSIVSESHWEVLWANLKAIYRILDPQNLYASYTHGATMTGLVKRIHDHIKTSSPALMFIKTNKLQVFGFFIPNLLHTPSKGYYTPQDMVCHMNSFIFTLMPYQKMYEFTSKNATGIKLSMDSIIVGGNEPAIIIDKTLSTGHTAKCESYDSPPLVSDAYFSVYMVEVWTLS